MRFDCLLSPAEKASAIARRVFTTRSLTRTHVELDCRGHVWKDEVYRTLIAEFSIKDLSWQALLSDYETQFQAYCVPFPFLLETLETLKQKGFLLGIVSNGFGEFQTRSIEGLGIQEYFDVVLISGFEQVRKP